MMVWGRSDRTFPRHFCGCGFPISKAVHVEKVGCLIVSLVLGLIISLVLGFLLLIKTEASNQPADCKKVLGDVFSIFLFSLT